MASAGTGHRSVPALQFVEGGGAFFDKRECAALSEKIIEIYSYGRGRRSCKANPVIPPCGRI